VDVALRYPTLWSRKVPFEGDVILWIVELLQLPSQKSLELGQAPSLGVS
jgi:hypothetical protein